MKALLVHSPGPVLLSPGHCDLRRPRAGRLHAVASRPTEGVAWDPEGLLPPLEAGSRHFARREARSKPPPAQPAPAHAQAHSLELPAAVSQGNVRSLCEASLSAFTPLDLDTPGVTVLHLDPPILTMDNFMSAEECADLIAAAEATGELQASAVGAGNAAAAGENAVTQRRTSRSMLLQRELLARQPQLQQLASRLQERAQKLLHTGGGQPWGATGRLPGPGQYCFEALQVAVYQHGQYFMTHEDAFPPDVVRQNRFQRSVTLLVYLNDVAHGGATVFEQLGVSVQPACGKALIFFPAFANGTADSRTLHRATDAVDTKYIAQQWIACGAPSSSPPAGAPSAAGWLSDEISSRARRSKKTKQKEARPAGRGFGAR